MYFLRLLILILASASLKAQTPAVLNYNVQDGLPSNLVYCGLQDSRGLLWFGTDKGLACFDGMNFRIYGVAEGLPDPEVLNIYEDREGRLWLFCFRKKPCYMLDGRIITEAEDNMLAKMDFTTGTNLMSETHSNSFWISSLGRRAYLCSGNTIKEYNFNFEVASFTKMDTTELILSLQGVYKFLPDGSIDPVLLFSERHSSNSIKVNGNRILYSFAQKIYLLEWSKGQLRIIAEQDRPVGQAYVDRLNRFWLCSPEGGAVVFDNDQRNFSNPVAYLLGKKVVQVFEDSEGTFWICTANEGVFALQQNPAFWYQNDFGFPSRNIRSISRNQEGKLLIGDDIGTIHVLSGEKIERSIATGSLDGSNHIRQTIPIGAGDFWYASDEELGYYDNKLSKRRVAVPNISLKGIQMLRDTLWWASATLLANTFKNESKRTVITSRFTAVNTDSEHCIWAGKVDGLYSRRDSFQLNWGDRFPALKSRIIAIQKAGNQQLWVVTANNGLLLVHLSAGAVRSVEVMDKIMPTPIENIQSLFVEPNGMVWMATNKGVCGYHPVKKRIVRYNALDGLTDNDVNTVLVHQDTLWVGTASGLTRIILKPQEVQSDFISLISKLSYEKNSQTYTLHLLDSIPGHRKITLPSDINNLQLELSGLDFRSRRNLKFKLIQHELLLPLYWWTFDNLIDWVSSGFKGKRDTIWRENSSYNLGTFLPPGKYKIQVSAIKSTGMQSRQPDTWTILKPPFWYQIVWVHLLVWAILFYIFWRIYWERAAYREIQAAASGLQLQALQAQMNPHFIGNAINAIQQFLHPPDPEKTSEYISIFMRLLRRTMHFSEKVLISFEEELSYNKEYLQLIQLRFEDRFKYEIIGADQIPAETPIPSMLIQPVLENATLHGIAPSGDAILRLEFKIIRDHFYCLLTDNGIGYKATLREKKLAGMESDSKGLSMLQKKVNTLNRLYDLDLQMTVVDLSELKTPGNGTRVTLRYCLSKIWKAQKEMPATTPSKE